MTTESLSVECIFLIGFIKGAELEIDSCRAMAYGVIEQALIDLFNPKSPNVVRGSARRWFRSSAKNPWCFEWICEHLNINPGVLRNFIRKNESAPLPLSYYSAYSSMIALFIDDNKV